jgi:serine/threonine protein kinase
MGLKHHRKVAVKVLRPELASLLGAERFLNKIRVTAGLQHPHILALHDSGEADSFLYFIMPCVEGESLRAIELDPVVRVLSGQEVPGSGVGDPRSWTPPGGSRALLLRGGACCPSASP